VREQHNVTNLIFQLRWVCNKRFLLFIDILQDEFIDKRLWNLHWLWVVSIFFPLEVFLCLLSVGFIVLVLTKHSWMRQTLTFALNVVFHNFDIRFIFIDTALDWTAHDRWVVLLSTGPCVEWVFRLEWWATSPCHVLSLFIPVVLCLETTKSLRLGIRIISDLLLVWIIIIFIIVFFAKKDFLLLMVFDHIWEELLNVLFACLSAQNIHIKLVSLELDNNLSYCPLEV